MMKWTKWMEIDKNNLNAKFPALSTDFSSPSPDSYECQKEVTDLKSGYFTATCLSSMNTSCKYAQTCCLS